MKPSLQDKKPSERISELMHFKRVGSPEAHMFAYVECIKEYLDEQHEKKGKE